MKDKYYSQAMKNFLVIAQCVFVALIVLCLRTIETRLDGTFDISQLGRSYEETAVFLRDAENTIRRKVDCSRNIALFQTAGETDLNKSIDIRQYVVGISDEANLNENLTYVLSDLINYYPDVKRLKPARWKKKGRREIPGTFLLKRYPTARRSFPSREVRWHPRHGRLPRPMRRFWNITRR